LAGGVDLDGTIGLEVLRLHREYHVKAVLADPWQMASIMNRWQRAGVRVREFPQTTQRTAADQALYDGITAGTLRTFPNPQLREAIRKAAAKDSERGTRLVKRPGDDLCVALSMAHYAALEGRETGGWVARVAEDLSWTGIIDGQGIFQFVSHDDEREPDPRSLQHRVTVERVRFSDVL
jgi:phage terminase large subunit-like protein